MSDYVTLSCPSCGGSLQITKDIERFSCAYCGNEHIVKRQGGVVSLIPVIETLQTIRAGTDKTASELAIARLKPEIEGIESFVEEVKASITKAIQNPKNLKDVKAVLARRRKSIIDRTVFMQSANMNSCIREIQQLTPFEYSLLKSNATFDAIYKNIENYKKYEIILQDKKNQLAKHMKIVSESDLSPIPPISNVAEPIRKPQETNKESEFIATQQPKGRKKKLSIKTILIIIGGIVVVCIVRLM